MTATERKRWWRAAAVAAVGGVVVTGGWFSLVRGKGEPDKADGPPPEAVNWTRTTAPPPAAPTVAEVDRTAAEPAPPTGPVTPAAATLPPIPTSVGGPVAPAVPVATPVPPAPIAVPAPVTPVSGPRIPDPALTGGDRSALPAVPPVPALPPAELPPLPTPPKAPEVKPVAPPTPPAPAGEALPKPAAPAAPFAPTPPGGSAPAIPPLPISTVEPPKAAAPVPPAPKPPVGVVPPMPEVPPPPAGLGGALLPQPTPVAPPAPSVNSADPVRPMLPVKPDSDLKPSNSGNTLNPTVAPAVPVVPAPAGLEPPARPVALPKPPEPAFGSTDKDVFPVRPVGDPRVPQQRDDTMLNLTTTAAVAVLGGAMLAFEKANVPPSAVPRPAIGAAPAVPLKADEKTDAEKLRTDLVAANKKIEDLEKQVKRLTELLSGKRDELGILVDPNAPGAAEEVKRLKDRVAALEKELTTLKTQTALKPAVVPEAKPKGTVKIVNEYPVEISMVINDKSYRVAPNTKLDVEIPAGDFTYQLLQSGAAATRSAIKEKETVTLRIK